MYVSHTEIEMILITIISHALPVNPCLICIMMELNYSANYILVLL